MFGSPFALVGTKCYAVDIHTPLKYLENFAGIPPLAQRGTSTAIATVTVMPYKGSTRGSIQFDLSL